MMTQKTFFRKHSNNLFITTIKLCLGLQCKEVFHVLQELNHTRGNTMTQDYLSALDVISTEKETLKKKNRTSWYDDVVDRFAKKKEH